MVGEPLVSVIIIFLDAERFLAEAVESVYAQSHRAWELLLVDDGSSDDSQRLARQYAARDPRRVRYLEHPGHENRGMSASRNRGLREAGGEFVTFLDADDVFTPDKLAAQVAIMRAHPAAAMVYGHALIWHGWTGTLEDAARDFRYELGVRPESRVPPPTLFHLLLANRAQTPMTGNALLRRSVVEQLGGFEEEFRGLYEDQVFFFKVNLAWPVYVSSQCWLKYRQHAASHVAGNAVGDYYSGRRALLEWLSAYVASQGFPPDSEIGRAVRRELWRARHPGLQRVLEPIRRISRRARREAQAPARPRSA
jgi:glycosyltransferase involved in cell wall biosynthesis